MRLLSRLVLCLALGACADTAPPADPAAGGPALATDDGAAASDAEDADEAGDIDELGGLSRYRVKRPFQRRGIELFALPTARLAPPLDEVAAALELDEAGAVSEARGIAHVVLARDPDNAPARILLAQCWLRIGHHDQALRELDAVPTSGPDAEWRALVAADAHHEADDSAAALAELAAAPDTLLVRYERVRIDLDGRGTEAQATEIDVLCAEGLAEACLVSRAQDARRARRKARKEARVKGGKGGKGGKMRKPAAPAAGAPRKPRPVSP